MLSHRHVGYSDTFSRSCIRTYPCINMFLHAYPTLTFDDNRRRWIPGSLVSVASSTGLVFRCVRFFGILRLGSELDWPPSHRGLLRGATRVCPAPGYRTDFRRRPDLCPAHNTTHGTSTAPAGRSHRNHRPWTNQYSYSRTTHQSNISVPDRTGPVLLFLPLNDSMSICLF